MYNILLQLTVSIVPVLHGHPLIPKRYKILQNHFKWMKYIAFYSLCVYVCVLERKLIWRAIAYKLKNLVRSFILFVEMMSVRSIFYTLYLGRKKNLIMLRCIKGGVRVVVVHVECFLLWKKGIKNFLISLWAIKTCVWLY